MILAFLGSCALQVSVAAIPPLARVFSLVPLTGIQWTIALCSPLVMLVFFRGGKAGEVSHS